MAAPAVIAAPGRAGAPLLLLGLLALAFLASLMAGSARIAPADIYAALVAPDGSYQQIVVTTLRLPRALAGLMVGAALAAAGAIMQGLTQNPLASPAILGVSPGAAFAVVLVTMLTGSGSLHLYTWVSFAGAAVAAVAVYGLASFGRGGATPLKLTLAGAVFAAFLGSLTSAVLIADADTLDQVRLWTVGSLSGRQMTQVASLLPYVACGLAAAYLLAPGITTQSLGADVATGLGQRTGLVRLAGAATVVVLAGSAVALAGPVAFVGLVAPHLARFMVGADYRLVIPVSASLGATLVLAADAAARTAFSGDELPVGIVMAMIGAPFFLYLARYRVHR